MLYKDRHSGFSLARIPSVDFSVIAAMFMLIVIAWGISKIDRSLVRAEAVIPEFTISGEMTVMPVMQQEAKKTQ